MTFKFLSTLQCTANNSKQTYHKHSLKLNILHGAVVALKGLNYWRLVWDVSDGQSGPKKGDFIIYLF